MSLALLGWLFNSYYLSLRISLKAYSNILLFNFTSVFHKLGTLQNLHSIEFFAIPLLPSLPFSNRFQIYKYIHSPLPHLLCHILKYFLKLLPPTPDKTEVL